MIFRFHLFQKKKFSDSDESEIKAGGSSIARTRFPHPGHGVGSESVINSESFTLSIEAKPVISDGYPQSQRLGVLS